MASMEAIVDLRKLQFRQMSWVRSCWGFRPALAHPGARRILGYASLDAPAIAEGVRQSGRVLTGLRTIKSAEEVST
jgi:hypothetical protein